MTETLTLTRAAQRAGVHRRTLRAWIRDGRLPAHLTPGGHYRVNADDLAALPMTTSEFARAVGVCQRTAVRWAKSGKLEASLDESGTWRIAASEVGRLGTRGTS